MYLRRTIKTTIWIMSFSVLAGLLGYIFRISLARNMSIAEYGLFYAIFTFLSFFTIFFDLGLTQSVSRYIVEKLVHKNYSNAKGALYKMFSYEIFISLIIALVFVVFSNLISSKIFHTDSYVFLFLMLIWFVTLPLDIFVKSALLGLQQQKIMALIDPTRTFIALAISLLLFNVVGSKAPFIAYASINILAFFIFAPFVVKKFPKFLSIKANISRKDVKKLFSLGILFALTSLGWALINYTDTAVISIIRGQVEVGFYQVAAPLAYAIMYFVNALGLVIFPMFSELNTREMRSKIEQGINLLYKYIFVGIIPVSMIFLAFPNLVISLLFGGKYLSAVPALRILAVGAVFFSVANFNSAVLCSIGKVKKAAILTISVAILNLILNIYLVKVYGFVGASIATAFCFFVLMVSTLVLLTREFKIKIPILKWFYSLIAGFIMLIAINYSKKLIVISNPYIEAIIVFIIGAIFYLIITEVTGATKKKEVIDLVKEFF